MRYKIGVFVATVAGSLVLPVNGAIAAGQPLQSTSIVPTSQTQLHTSVDQLSPALPAKKKKKKKRAKTTLKGWYTQTRIDEPRFRVRDKVRVITRRGDRRRKVSLQRKKPGETWATVWTRRTTKKGRLVAEYNAPKRGARYYRLKVRKTKDAKKVSSEKRRLVSIPAVKSGETRVFAVGDVGMCGGWAGLTAGLMTNRPGSVVIPGDIAYPYGKTSDFQTCYDPSFGQFRNRTYPVPGNHEYLDDTTAAPYFAYFGARVGTSAQPWYVQDFGSWRFFMLNSNCELVGGCEPGSPQYEWLEQQLAATTNQCTAAVWHHPRWTSSTYKPKRKVRHMYELLANHGTDVLLTGHRHHYERFDRLNADEQIDPFGIRQFVVGTGGHFLMPFRPIPAIGSQSRISDSHGVLQMDLSATALRWQFQQSGTGDVKDSGYETCH